jgi:hypothetical protein
MQPFQYTSAGNFTEQVDLSIAGMLQECAECHVGGGAMEYVPAPTMAGRTSLRDITTANVNGFGSIGSGNYTAFNWFVDTYDCDNDTVRTDLLLMDWGNTGVLEMDCLLCHLEGYDYDVRREMLRQSRFDASRAVGAGVAAPNIAAVWPTDGTAPAGYGTQVTYNDLVVDSGGDAAFSDTILLNIKGVPPSKNCAFCHANFPGVDWKKRGDSWRNVRTDAHYVLQCMGCHEGKVGSAIGTSGDASSPDLGQCDPAKGVAPYSGIWNAKDASIKTCKNCHLRAGYDSTLLEYSPDYGAPDPTGTHEYYGLTALLCQSDTNSTHPSGPDSSHVDIVGCEACHIQKLPDEDWNTGGAVVDATGEDHVGRMADHENIYVQRSIQNNLVYQWQYGKVIPTSVLTTVFWRDKNTTYDVNVDGQPDGMDPPLTTHILSVNEANSWECMTRDNAGNIDSAVLGARISALNAGLPALNGDTSDTPNVQLCSLSVPFIVTHNVSPASYALGHECSDCHDSTGSKGLWNGTYELMGDLMSLNATAGQITPFTKVNPGDQFTDFHFNLKNRPATRSIAIRPISEGTDNATTVTRCQTLYEASLTQGGNFTAEDGVTTYSTGAAWCDYLNTIDVSACSYYPDANATATVNATHIGNYGHGIGCNTGYGTVNASACVMYWPLYEVDAGKTVTFHGDDVCPGTEYYWNFNDASGFVEGTQFSAVGQDRTHEFRKLGIYKVLLTVKNLYGNVDQEMILVNVVKP